MSQSPVIDLRRVMKTYGEGDTAVHAVAGVSLQVERGDYVAVMGASGSGKSSLMNIIGCLDLPTSGSYRLDGIDVRRLTDDQQSRPAAGHGLPLEHGDLVALPGEVAGGGQSGQPGAHHQDAAHMPCSSRPLGA